ncbi:MAG: alpha/beta hydrolase [Paludibacter sp.]|nr:alpha/beta hydrolase [Paludibacter sp.]
MFLLVFFLIAGMMVQAQEYRTEFDVAYYPATETDPYIQERCQLDVYYPAEKKAFPTLVWFHGGGLSGGEKHIPDGLRQQGMAVVAVNYRLTPRVKSPEYLRDAAAAVVWVMKNIANYGGDATKVYVAGHSAGGYLAAMIGLDKSWLAVHDMDANQLAGIISLSGQAITHFSVRSERSIPDYQPVVDHLAPLFHVRKDAPPLLLITGDRELEMLGRYEENAYLMRMMKVAGHQHTTLYELQGYGHNMVEPAIPLLRKQMFNY